MNKPLSAQTLTGLVHFLLKRSNEAHARAETMRMLLEKHGVFFADEFSAVFAQQEAAVKERSKLLLSRLLTNERSEAQRQFLEAFEGTVQ